VESIKSDTPLAFLHTTAKKDQVTILKRTKTLPVVLLLIALMLAITYSPAQVKAQRPQVTWPLEGPHVSEVRFVIFGSTEAEIPALKAGDVDFGPELGLPVEHLPDIQGDPNIKIIQGIEQGFWGFSLQTERYPLSIVDFRRAIRSLTDKDTMVSEGLHGQGVRLDGVLGPGYGRWHNPNVPKSEFNPAAAAQILDGLGFTLGADGKRIDPQTGKTMRPLLIYARTEHPHRVFSAQTLAKAFDQVGIPYDLQIVPRRVTSVEVLQKQQYDIYTAGWGGGPDVDWLYDLFYSESPPTQNYELYKSPAADEQLKILKFDPDVNKVKDAVWKFQEILADEAPFIPLYAQYYITTYRSNIKNVIDVPSWTGVVNSATFLTAYPEGNEYSGALRVAWSSDLTQPSPMYEINWWWDTMANSVIYDSPIALDPNTFEDIPWMAKSWKVEPWTAPGNVAGLKITFNLRDDITWHDSFPFAAEDLAFSWEYARDQRNPVYISYVSSLVKAETLDKYTAVGYMNTTSYWALHWLGAVIPVIPKHVWKDIAESITYQPVSEGKLIGTGPFMFKEYKPGEYFIVTANPNYFMKPAGSTIGFPKLTLTQGDTKALTSTPLTVKIDTTVTPITNGTYMLKVVDSTGAVVKTFTGTAASDGTYSATLDTTDIPPGAYTVLAELAGSAGGKPLGSTETYQLTVEAKPFFTPTVIASIVAVIVIIIAAGYVVIRRRPKKTPK